MDFSKHLFRCSSLGHLMTPPQGDTPMEKWQKACAKHAEHITKAPERFNKNGSQSKLFDKWQEKGVELARVVAELEAKKHDIELSESAKVHLSDVHTSITTGRSNDIENKYIKKGLMVEEDSITLYSRLKKKFFKKNETQLKNGFISGTPDIFEGETIGSAISVPDIKSSWDIYTFRRTFVKSLNKLYYWQLQGYMWLTGASVAPLAYCLVNTPDSLIEQACKSLWYKLGCPDEYDDNFIEACSELKKSMTYDDLPLHKKLLEYVVDRNDDDIKLIEKYVVAGRAYLQELDNKLNEKQGE
jgi:hypothetical protein